MEESGKNSEKKIMSNYNIEWLKSVLIDSEMWVCEIWVCEIWERENTMERFASGTKM